MSRPSWRINFLLCYIRCMGRGKNYTEEEKQYIRENAGHLPTEDIADYLKRSVSSVRTMAQRLRVPIRNDYYTEEEESFIREWAGKKPWHEIASELGRPEQGVHTWACKRGISGSQNHTHQRSQFTEIRMCGGLFCEKEFPIRRNWQKYCSESCAQTIYHLLKYNLTKERWWEIFRSQGEACICGLTEHSKSWHVDHDHSCCPYGISCGECVRGILCEDCNHALGKVRDNPETLRALAGYLEKSFHFK